MKPTYSFTYTQGTQSLTITFIPYIKHGNAYADIDSVPWNGVDVYALLEAWDILDDILATAERKAESLLVIEEND